MTVILEERMEEIRNVKIAEYQVLRLLEAYYDTYIEDICAVRDPDGYPVELTLPLEDRESGMLEAMDELTHTGYDLDEGDFYNPLMISVGYADAPMTRYLLEHGADPCYWTGIEEEPLFMRRNYYYDDIDIAYFDERWKHSSE